jgi:hypothetical protein
MDWSLLLEKNPWTISKKDLKDKAIPMSLFLYSLD